MAQFKYVGEANKFHLKDDKNKKALVNGEVVEIAVKRAEEANKKHGEIFERIEEKEEVEKVEEVTEK